MPRKIDWGRMLFDLEVKLEKIKNSVEKNDISVRLTLGKRPPRIYAEWLFYEKLEKIEKNVSPIATEKHRKVIEAINEEGQMLRQIMKEHDLKEYIVRNPSFKGQLYYGYSFGFNHKQYQIK